MNTYGTQFRVTTYGESHGLAVGAIIDGCPAGICLDMDEIKRQLSRRRGDGEQGTTPRHEPDQVEFLSGLADGITLGTPLSFRICNQDVDSTPYEVLREADRPGHADYSYRMRYGLRDHRGGGRASARETVARVVAGTIARGLMPEVAFEAKVVETGVGSVNTTDTYGGIVECSITGVPAGIGDPVFGKLNAALAGAMFTIPSVIGFEMGSGFAAAKMSGKEFIDRWHPSADGTTLTNHCGGIQGGISNGMPITFRVAFHAAPTIHSEVELLDHDGALTPHTFQGRHDTCHVVRTPVIVESMAALCLINYMQ